MINKKSYIFWIVLFGLASMVMGDSKKSYTPQKHSFQYLLTNFITVSPFSGGLILYKYHIAKKHSFWYGLSFKIKRKTINDTLHKLNNNIVFNSIKTNIQSFGVLLTYLNYKKINNLLSLFCGIGSDLNLNKINFHTEYASKINQKYPEIVGQLESTYSYGLSINFGVEWEINHYYSLLFKQKLNASYNNVKIRMIKSKDNIISEQDIYQYNYWSIASKLFQFGITFYL